MPRTGRGLLFSGGSRLVAFNKPHGVVCQFSGHDKHRSLAEFIDIPAIYAAGRLDTDSEGLLLLTANGLVQQAIADPESKLPKVYWAQVEGIPEEASLARMRGGLDLGDFVTRPCDVRRIEAPPSIWPRDPPVRYRKLIPTSWLEVVLTEGKNRQVRRMTAKVGLPTLRLIRKSVGPFSVVGMPPGTWRDVDAALLPEIAATSPVPDPGVPGQNRQNRTRSRGGRQG